MYAYMYSFYFILLITTKYHHQYVVIGEWERPLFCEINVPVNDYLPKCKRTRWCMQKKKVCQVILFAQWFLSDSEPALGVDCDACM